VEIFDQDETVTHFADLLLPVPIPRLFTYRVPRELNGKILIGQRAIIPFGDRKILTGVIITVHQNPPQDYEAKYIFDLLDDFPAVGDLQYKLFQWIADYYLCSVGEVMNAALPSGLKLSSESMVQLNPAFDPEETKHEFSEKEHILLDNLRNDSMAYSEISKLLGVKQLYNILKSLVRKEAVILFEEVREKYKPKTERRVRLTPQYSAAHLLERLFEKLSSKPKQEAIVLKYLQLVPILQHPSSNTAGLKRSQLTEHESESSLKTLIKAGIFEEYDTIVSRFGDEEEHTGVSIPLSPEQQHAFHEIIKSFATHDTTLLHGITGSGKTEIYINLIKQAIDSGSQVLYLLPEIALTTQIVRRLIKVFGKNVGVYHSKFSDNERVEVWNGVLSGRFKFVIGVRSSVFLPFDNLGLVIVDEEHDPSYKQQEPAPRYHARDVAIMMAKMHHAKILLGSATPSIETYYQAQHNKYGLVALTKRYGEAKLPMIKLADMGRERRYKTAKGDFSSLLINSIHDTLSQKEQVIIFQNRRGYSPILSCEDCGWVPKCVNCAVSLTYHQYRNSLVCHYCGYRQPLPQQCVSCSSTRLKTVGYGTEKLEEELQIHFPDTRIGRMDLDTTRTKSGYETIISDFEQGETQILVGTQMVTKGLDFDRVSLVGIFSADRMLHFPDFRSYERAYQLIMQVSGRAGRREKPGLVIIQTSNPEHPLLQTILNRDAAYFYREQITDRQLHAYPPFTRLIELTVKHLDKKQTIKTADGLARALRDALPAVRILGPADPVISKIRNQYLMTILVKIPRQQGDLAKTKSILLRCVNEILKEKESRNSRIVIDVDPL
jgi:primosomal protein N' (replication factor Y) (superfamily II helicase)